MAEKQQTKQTNYSSLSLSASMVTQDTLQGGIIVECSKFWHEIPVCYGRLLQVKPVAAFSITILSEFKYSKFKNSDQKSLKNINELCTIRRKNDVKDVDVFF